MKQQKTAAAQKQAKQACNAAVVLRNIPL